MITVTYKTLAKAVDSGAFERFVTDKKIPIAFCHPLKRLRKQVNEFMETYREAVGEIAEKYGEELPNQHGGVSYIFKEPGSKKAFDLELKEYGANTIDLDTDVYFEETELITPVGSPSDRTSADLDDLDWLIMEGKRPEREPEPKEEPDDTHQPDEE